MSFPSQNGGYCTIQESDPRYGSHFRNQTPSNPTLPSVSNDSPSFYNARPQFDQHRIQLDQQRSVQYASQQHQGYAYHPPEHHNNLINLDSNHNSQSFRSPLQQAYIAGNSSNTQNLDFKYPPNEQPFSLFQTSLVEPDVRSGAVPLKNMEPHLGRDIARHSNSSFRSQQDELNHNGTEFSKKTMNSIEGENPVLSELFRCHSYLELFAVTLHHSLHVTHDQALSLLTVRVTDLGNLARLGLNGGYGSIIKWLSLVAQSLPSLCALVAREHRAAINNPLPQFQLKNYKLGGKGNNTDPCFSGNPLLNALSILGCGLGSASVQVCSDTLSLMHRFMCCMSSYPFPDSGSAVSLPRRQHGFHQEQHGFHQEQHGFHQEQHGFHQEQHEFQQEQYGYHQEQHQNQNHNQQQYNNPHQQHHQLQASTPHSQHQVSNTQHNEHAGQEELEGLDAVKQVFSGWLSDNNQIEVYILTFRLHSDVQLRHLLFQTLYMFCDDQVLSTMFPQQIRDSSIQPYYFVNFVLELYTNFAAFTTGTSRSNTDTVEMRLHNSILANTELKVMTLYQVLFVGSAYSSPTQTIQVRIMAATSFLRLWSAFPGIAVAWATSQNMLPPSNPPNSLTRSGIVDSNDTIRKLLSPLSLCLHDNSSANLQIHAMAEAFQLFESLLDKCDSDFVPYIFKTIIFVLVTSRSKHRLRDVNSNPDNGTFGTEAERDELFLVRNFVSFNLQETLKHYSCIPVDELLGPLIQQQAKEGIRNLDFELWKVVAEHKQLSVNGAVHLAMHMEHISRSRPSLELISFEILIALYSRFHTSRDMCSRITQFCQALLDKVPSYVTAAYGISRRNNSPRRQKGGKVHSQSESYQHSQSNSNRGRTSGNKRGRDNRIGTTYSQQRQHRLLLKAKTSNTQPDFAAGLNSRRKSNECNPILEFLTHDENLKKLEDINRLAGKRQRVVNFIIRVIHFENFQLNRVLFKRIDKTMTVVHATEVKLKGSSATIKQPVSSRTNKHSSQRSDDWNVSAKYVTETQTSMVNLMRVIEDLAVNCGIVDTNFANLLCEGSPGSSSLAIKLQAPPSNSLTFSPALYPTSLRNGTNTFAEEENGRDGSEHGNNTGMPWGSESPTRRIAGNIRHNLQHTVCPDNGTLPKISSNGIVHDETCNSNKVRNDIGQPVQQQKGNTKKNGKQIPQQYLRGLRAVFNKTVSEQTTLLGGGYDAILGKSSPLAGDSPEQLLMSSNSLHNEGMSPEASMIRLRLSAWLGLLRKLGTIPELWSKLVAKTVFAQVTGATSSAFHSSSPAMDWSSFVKAIGILAGEAVSEPRSKSRLLLRTKNPGDNLNYHDLLRVALDVIKEASIATGIVPPRAWDVKDNNAKGLQENVEIDVKQNEFQCNNTKQSLNSHLSQEDLEAANIPTESYHDDCSSSASDEVRDDDCSDNKFTSRIQSVDISSQPNLSTNLECYEGQEGGTDLEKTYEPDANVDDDDNSESSYETNNLLEIPNEVTLKNERFDLRNDCSEQTEGIAPGLGQSQIPDHDTAGKISQFPHSVDSIVRHEGDDAEKVIGVQQGNTDVGLVDVAEEKQVDAVEEEEKQVDADEEEKQVDAVEEEEKQVDAVEEEKQVDAVEKEKQVDAVEEEEKQVDAVEEEEKQVDAVEEEEKQVDAVEEEKQVDAVEEEKQVDAVEKEKQVDAVEEEEKQVDAVEEEKQVDAVEEEKQVDAVEEEEKQVDTVEEEEQSFSEREQLDVTTKLNDTSVNQLETAISATTIKNSENGEPDGVAIIEQWNDDPSGTVTHDDNHTTAIDEKANSKSSIEFKKPEVKEKFDGVESPEIENREEQFIESGTTDPEVVNLNVDDEAAGESKVRNDAKEDTADEDVQQTGVGDNVDSVEREATGSNELQNLAVDMSKVDVQTSEMENAKEDAVEETAVDDTRENAKSTEIEELQEDTKATETEETKDDAKTIETEETKDDVKATETEETKDDAKTIETEETKDDAKATETEETKDDAKTIETEETKDDVKATETEETKDDAKTIETEETKDDAKATETEETKDDANSTETEETKDDAKATETEETKDDAKTIETEETKDDVKATETEETKDDAKTIETEETKDDAKATETEETKDDAKATETEETKDDANSTETEETKDDAKATETEETKDDAKTIETEETKDDVKATETEETKDDANSTETEELQDDANSTETEETKDDAKAVETDETKDDAKTIGIEETKDDVKTIKTEETKDDVKAAGTEMSKDDIKTTETDKAKDDAKRSTDE